MKIIGLTGKTGAGKSSVAALLSQHGYPVIDCDKVAHTVTERLLPELEHYFPGVVRDGVLDRARLSTQAFASDEGRRTLNRVTHGAILEEVERQIAVFAAERPAPKAVIVDGAALIESGFTARCDLLLTVIAPEKVRLARLLQRDRRTEKELRARIAAQADDRFYTEPADVIIENCGDRAALERAVQIAIERIEE